MLAIDWDSESIRIIHAVVGRKGPGRIRGVLVPITEGVDVDDPESLGQFIARALKQRKIRTRRAVVAIPRDQAVLHMLSLPNVPPEEMPSVVHFQITKELPFALEEARIDFATFPAEAESETVDVLVAAVRNDVLEHLQSVCVSAGLELERVGLRPFANTVSQTFGREQVSTGCQLFVDVGPVLTEIDLIRGGHLAFSRAASVSVPIMPTVRVKAALEDPSGPVTIAPTEQEQEEAVANLIVEVNRTIEAYRVSAPGAEIDSIVVGGSCGIEERFCREVADRFGAPATLYNPGQTLLMLRDRGEELTAFSAPLGLAVGHGTEGTLHFDFLHPKEPVDLSKVKARKVPVIGATVVVFILAIVVLRQQLPKATEAKVKDLQRKVDVLKKKAKEVEQFEQQVARAEEWEKQEWVWLDDLAKITDLFPPTTDAYTTKLIAKVDGTIALSVRAKKMSELEPLRERLERVGPFNATLGTTKEVTDPRGFQAEGEFILTPKTAQAEATPKTSKTSKSSSKSKTR